MDAFSIDFNHIIYLYPSDTLGALLVSHQLTGIENYSVWSHSLRIVFLAKNKLGFPDGDRCNAIALSWILNDVSKELSSGIIFASSAALFWKDLKECYDKVDGSPLPSMNQSYSMLIQEESQRAHLSGISLIVDSNVMYSNLFEVSNSTRRRFNGICDHYKIKGHKKEQCYRLIGFPSDFKFSKKKGCSSNFGH
ncbi:hypothetical protein V6Z11_A08G181600 [Gossypium hirsutum]